MNKNLLSVENLSVIFSNGKPVKAVDNISFNMAEEEILGLVGESGCGKTLTALSIMKLLPPNADLSGKVIFKGHDILKKNENDLRNIRGKEISLVFQEPMTSLNPVFTVGDQVAEVLITHSKMKKKEALIKTIELLREVGIPSPETRIKEYPHQMSGGMRQRIMISMAIACYPALIIADEPTTALDVTIQAQILELLDSLKTNNRMSILLITHDLGIIAEWADRVEIMYAGRIIEKAAVKEIFNNPRHPYTIGLLESLPKKKGIRLVPIPGQVPKMGMLPEGCKFNTRCRYAINECHVKEPELTPVGGETQLHLSRCIRAMDL